MKKNWKYLAGLVVGILAALAAAAIWFREWLSGLLNF